MENNKIQMAYDLLEALVDVFGLECEDAVWEAISPILEIGEPDDEYRRKFEELRSE